MAVYHMHVKPAKSRGFLIHNAIIKFLIVIQELTE